MTNYRPRDKNGWRVPQIGTISRAIYECLLSDIPPIEIYRWVCYRFDNPCTIQTLRVIIHEIKHPDRAIKGSRRGYEKKRQLSLDLGDRPKRCEGCDRYYADPPSRLCPGCEAYAEHQA